MMLIPTAPKTPHYSMQVPLEGTGYTLEFRWNTRESAWYMHVKTDIGDEILDSLKVVVSWPLGFRSQDARRPPGCFLAQDTSGLGLDPGLNDLGDRVQLYYVEAAEASTLGLF
jgi:hypothetical protein